MSKTINSGQNETFNKLLELRRNDTITEFKSFVDEDGIH